METIGIAIVGFIILSFFILIIWGIGSSVGRISQSRENTKALINSTGLKKICLIVRSEAISFSAKLKKDGSETPWFNLKVPVLTAYPILADAFYGSLEEAFNGIGRSDAFDELAVAISKDFTEQKIISARIFGVSLGITIAKAANESGKRIKKAALKRYLNSCSFDEIYKKEIIKMVTAYIDFEQDKLFGAHSEAAFTSQDLGKMAYSMLDEKLEKGKYPDPIISTAMNLAIAIAYSNTPLDDTIIAELKIAGLIS